MRDELVQIKSFTSKLLLAQVGQKTVKKVVMRRPGLDLDLGCYWWSGGSQICLPASLPTGPWPRGPCGTFIFSRELSTHVGSPEVFARRSPTRSGRRCTEKIRLQTTPTLKMKDRTPCTGRHLISYSMSYYEDKLWKFRGWNFQFFLCSFFEWSNRRNLSLFCICKFREQEGKFSLHLG